MLTVSADARDGTCYFDVAATDPSTGQQVWHQEGLNLRTADNGTGCKQGQDPVGGHDVVLGVNPLGHEVLVDAHDGRVLWLGDAEQKVLAVDDRYALIRSADGDTVSARSFGKGRTAWRRPLTANAQAALTPYAAVVVVGEAPQGHRAAPGHGRRCWPRCARRRGCSRSGRAGLIISAGRDLAYVPFASSS